MRESDVEKYLCKEVTARGGACWKWVSPGRRGVPDRVVLHNGRARFVELKAPRGRLSAVQEMTHRALRSLGFEVAVLSSKQEVNEWLKKMEW